MAASRIVRPASRFWSYSQSPASFSNALRPASSLPALTKRRTYATPSGVKEVAVRDALNEALAEELESNSKVFVLGEEVAQYNGASVAPAETRRHADHVMFLRFSTRSREHLLAQANPSACSYKVTKGLLDRFGEKRVIDSPITESGFAGLTIGAALAGLHPVVCSAMSHLNRL